MTTINHTGHNKLGEWVNAMKSKTEGNKMSEVKTNLATEQVSKDLFDGLITDKDLEKIQKNLEIQTLLLVTNVGNNTSRVNKIATGVVVEVNGWAAKNPKTAVAVGAATVAAAGYGLYQMAKLAKKYI